MTPGDLGFLSVGAAAMLAAVKTIDYLVRQKDVRNGNGRLASYRYETCKAESCDAHQVTARLQEYHGENRQVMKEMRDGINTLVTLTRENNNRRDWKD